MCCSWLLRSKYFFALFLKQVIVVKRQRFSVPHLSSAGSIARGLTYRKDCKFLPMDFNELVLQEIPDAVVVLTPEGRIANWTNGAQQVCGYDSMETSGRRLHELLVPLFVPQELHDWKLHSLALLKPADTCSHESVRRTSSGAFIHVDISSKAVHADDGAFAYVLSSQKDLTELKVRHDATLPEEKFNDLLECMPDGIRVSNATGHIAPVNSRAERLFEYGHHDLHGPHASHCEDRFRLHSDEPQQACGDFRNAGPATVVESSD